MRAFIAAAFAALALLATPTLAAAQGYRAPDVAEQREAMARLAPLIGRWSGTANVLSPQEILVHQTEFVETAMDGALLIVRGTGYSTPDRTGDPIFQALAIISYDDARDIYEFRTYARGHANTATGRFIEDGVFRWSLEPGGPVRVQYTITFDSNTWREIGEMSYDGGQTWRRTIDMNLTRSR
jgi:hypothetical protein